MKAHTLSHESASTNAWFFGWTLSHPWMELHAARTVCHTTTKQFLLREWDVMSAWDVPFAMAPYCMVVCVEMSEHDSET